MVDIIHRIGIQALPKPVYEALSTVQGISKWWTQTTTGDSTAGNSFEVRFLDFSGEELGFMVMDVVECQPDARVRWRCKSGPPEWIGTEIIFELVQEGDFTIVLFRHENWREAVEFTAHCSTKWATFLLSLKSLIEQGTGKPSPNDLKIDNWN